MMGKYDDYSAEFFKGSRYWPRDLRTSWRAIYQYDYEKLKLFMLSMLWRAAAATQEFYSVVQLDEPTMKDLQDTIERKDPGTAQDYSVMIAMRERHNGLEKVGWNPTITERLDGLKWSRFDLNEFSCDIKISRQPTSFDERVLLTDKPPLLVVTGPTFDKRVSQFKSHSLAQQERERQYKESHKRKE